MNIGKHMVATADGDGWLVKTKRGHHLLGRIEWHREWKQFEFVPQWGSAFSWDCLAAMSKRLFELTAEELKRRAAKP